MRILICDDNKTILQTLKDILLDFFKKNNYTTPEIVCYTDGMSLKADKGKKDIVFLDIKLPDINGIDLGQELCKANSNCIIMVITSYMDYLDDAMRFHVFRYIQKPFEITRLIRNLNEAISLYNSRNHIVMIETKEHIYSVNTSDIIAVESSRRKVLLYTLQGTRVSTKKMEYWEKTLPSGSFFRTHRNFIVNFNHVTDFNADTINVTNNITNVYLAARKYKIFKQAFTLFIEHQQ